MGIYDATGTLLEDTAQVAAVAGPNTLALNSPVNIVDDTLYYLAIWNDNNNPRFWSINAGASTRARIEVPTVGALPANVTINGANNRTKGFFVLASV